jgi:xylulokinase
MPSYLLGLDIGGSGAKAGLFPVDGTRGRTAQVEYRMTTALPGQAEQDADAWWTAAASVVRTVVDGVDPNEILGVGVGCTNGIVAVSRDARPLRPAIMLWDQRSLGEVQEIRTLLGAECVLGVTGNPIAPGAYSLPTLLWLKRHEPRTFEAAHKLMVPGGYLVARLTGAFTIDHSRACTTLLFDIQRRAWHRPFLEAVGVPESKLPDPLPSEGLAGRVTPQAAALTGLAPGTPVVAGCMDTIGASIGCGVIEPGQCFVIMGTAARVAAPLGVPSFDPRFMNCTHVAPDAWLTIGALNGVGSSWRWMRDTFGHEEQAIAASAGESAYDLLAAAAARAPVGSKGLVFLPYISGERTPIWDPFARAVFFGVTLGHTRNDFLRSVLEGTAFAIRQVVEILEQERGLAIPELRISGSAAVNGVWNQIIADVTGKDVVTMAERQSEELGAAIIAGVGLGVFADYQGATARMVATDRRFPWNRTAHAAYDQLFPVYRDLYGDLKPHFERLAGLALDQVWVTQGEIDDRRGPSSAADLLCTTGLRPGAGGWPGR